jgi:hypothetical protein
VTSSNPELHEFVTRYLAPRGFDPTEFFGLNAEASDNTAAPHCSGMERKCEGFYTWTNFNTAADQYNAIATRNPKYPHFLHPTNPEHTALNIIALFANANIESDAYRACRERVLVPQHECTGCRFCHYPGNHCCPDPINGCSAGQIDHYTSSRARSQQFTKTTCNGVSAPTKGCKDAWGNPVADARNCYFARGLLQLTWPANYEKAAEPLRDLLNIDLCNDPDKVCSDPIAAYVTSIQYWASKVQPGWCGGARCSIDTAIDLIGPEDKRANPRRVALFEQYVDALGLAAAVGGPYALQAGHNHAAGGAESPAGGVHKPCGDRCGNCVGSNNHAQEATDAHCQPCGGKHGQKWWPCNVAGLCTCTVEVASGAEGRMGLVSRALSVVSLLYSWEWIFFGRK